MRRPVEESHSPILRLRCVRREHTRRGDRVGGALWGELAVGVISTCLGYASLRLLERRARTAGRLELL